VKGSDRSRGGARPVTADKKIHPVDISLPIAGFAHSSWGKYSFPAIAMRAPVKALIPTG
jgi:hypothetical protein